MIGKEEDLEFISVSQDEDNDMTSAYVDPTQPDRANNMIGNWLLNQSKVAELFLSSLSVRVLIYSFI